MNKMTSFIMMAIMGLALVSCDKQKSLNDSHPTYNESDVDKRPQEPETKNYLVPGLDHGLLQSPINILSNETEAGRHSITVNFSDEINQVDNLGHTVQLDIKEGSTITVDQKTYEFKQIHFHTPAEHLIDGITYPMEMHIVNKLIGDETEYLVFAFHFKMGKENKFISQFLNLIPKNEDQSKEIATGTVKLRNLFGKNPREEWNSYYNYKGSLTTPPYTESVNWFVVKKIFNASSDQIQKINLIEGDNARHIQAEYNRTINQE